tara:strand:+ start:34 stop:264 length:231 start_codon:yes stop_codon:yes gene_type:complete
MSNQRAWMKYTGDDRFNRATELVNSYSPSDVSVLHNYLIGNSYYQRNDPRAESGMRSNLIRFFCDVHALDQSDWNK